MSFQSDLYTALSGVAGGRVYPQTAPQETPLPLVVWRILNKTPNLRLGGPDGLTQYAVEFQCWADDHVEALDLADQVAVALGASALTHYPDSSPGEDFEPAIDAFVEPVYFGFWHNAP